MNYKGILFFLGIYSIIISFFSFINILYSIYFNSTPGFNLYLAPLLISLVLGVIFCLTGKNHTKNIFIYDQILLILVSFIFLPFLICLPYYFSIHDLGLLNSYFESISGFTTTSFSIFNDLQIIDEPLLLWRSSSQWIGGLLFLIAIIGTLGTKRIKIKPIYLISGVSLGGNFYNDFYSNFIKVLLIYFFTTIFVVFLYGLVDIRFFDSFNLALTTVSSGGFLSKNNLSDITTNNFQIFVLSITLLIPIFNFYLLVKIFTRQFKIQDYQEDLHLGIFIITLTLFFYFFVISNEGIADVFLAVTSSISTSGISTYSSNYDLSLFLILLTIIGGSLLSTSSGLKYIRFYILLKISYQEIYKLVKPKNIFNNNLFRSEIKITDEDSKISFLIFISFIIAVFILTAALTLDNLSFENSFKLAILTLTNTAATSLYDLENLNFFDLSSFTKIILMIFMIFGKIEIIAVLFLFSKRFF